MSSKQLARLRAAAIDGRSQNVYFRQEQLERLCKGLLDEESALRQAMIEDCYYSASEAITVLHASVQAIKIVYAGLHPDQSLKQEYRTAHGKDVADGKVPFGMVYIEPEAHTLLYSICAPLSAALAAGNCVAVVLENSLRQLPSLIRKILVGALDADSFAAISSPTQDRDFLENALIVRGADGQSWPKANELLSSSRSPAVAVVDRTADIELAAREIALARSAFSGTSPCAPDVVMVNEFILDDFVDRLAREVSATQTKSAPREKRVGRAVQVDCRGGKVTPVPPGRGSSQVLREKQNDAILHVRPIRSLDDAINLLEQHRQGTYLATYHFCDLRSAKYLSQFVEAEVTFVNQVPRQVLIGPPTPKCHQVDLQQKYPVALFSRRRPVFVEKTSDGQKMATALATADNATAQELLQEARQPLKEMKRHPGGGVGFFEQAILLNVSFILLSVATLSTAGVWKAWRWYSLR